MDLKIVCVFTAFSLVPKKRLMCRLLDPFEEQFHLPAALVQSGNGQRGRLVLLVRNTIVLPILESLTRMRRKCSG